MRWIQSKAECSAGTATHAATDLPILALISSPTFPDPLPTYSSSSSNLAIFLANAHHDHMTDLAHSIYLRPDPTEAVIASCNITCPRHAFCIGQLHAVTWRFVSQLTSLPCASSTETWATAPSAALLPSTVTDHCACVNVWGDVQPLNVRSWHLHARVAASAQS